MWWFRIYVLCPCYFTLLRTARHDFANDSRVSGNRKEVTGYRIGECGQRAWKQHIESNSPRCCRGWFGSAKSFLCYTSDAVWRRPLRGINGAPPRGAASRGRAPLPVRGCVGVAGRDWKVVASAILYPSTRLRRFKCRATLLLYFPATPPPRCAPLGAVGVRRD